MSFVARAQIHVSNWEEVACGEAADDGKGDVWKQIRSSEREQSVCSEYSHGSPGRDARLMIEAVANAKQRPRNAV